MTGAVEAARPYQAQLDRQAPARSHGREQPSGERVSALDRPPPGLACWFRGEKRRTNTIAGASGLLEAQTCHPDSVRRGPSLSLFSLPSPIVPNCGYPRRTTMLVGQVPTKNHWWAVAGGNLNAVRTSSNEVKEARTRLASAAICCTRAPRVEAGAHCRDPASPCRHHSWC